MQFFLKYTDRQKKDAQKSVFFTGWHQKDSKSTVLMIAVVAGTVIVILVILFHQINKRVESFIQETKKGRNGSIPIHNHFAEIHFHFIGVNDKISRIGRGKIFATSLKERCFHEGVFELIVDTQQFILYIQDGEQMLIASRGTHSSMVESRSAGQIIEIGNTFFECVGNLFRHRKQKR